VVPAHDVPGCPARRRRKSGLLVQLLLPESEALGVRSRRGHENLRALLSGERWTGVHGDAPLSQVHVRRPWWRTPIVVGGGVIGSRGGVATTVSTVVTILAAITAIAVVVVLGPVVVAIIAVVRAAAIGLVRRARRHGRR
jgi:hypothetical protein